MKKQLYFNKESNSDVLYNNTFLPKSFAFGLNKFHGINKTFLLDKEPIHAYSKIEKNTQYTNNPEG